MAMLRKQKAYSGVQHQSSHMSSFRQKDQESVNKVHGLADLTEIELIKKQKQLVAERVGLNNEEEIDRGQLRKYKEVLMQQYLLEQEAKSAINNTADCPVELTSQKEKNQIIRRQLEIKRKENESNLHELHKRQKVTLIQPSFADEEEDVGPSMALFVHQEEK